MPSRLSPSGTTRESIFLERGRGRVAPSLSAGFGGACCSPHQADASGAAVRAPPVAAGRRLPALSHWPSDPAPRPGASSLPALEALPISPACSPRWLFLAPSRLASALGASRALALVPAPLTATPGCTPCSAPQTACAARAGPGAGRGAGRPEHFSCARGAHSLVCLVPTRLKLLEGRDRHTRLGVARSRSPGPVRGRGATEPAA